MLGWILYFISIANAISNITLIVAIIIAMVLIVVFICYQIDDLSQSYAIKLYKNLRIWFFVCLFLSVIIPRKEISYQIFAVQTAAEVVKNSEALQQLPEKSFETLNRILDSIAKEEKENTKEGTIIKNQIECQQSDR